MLKNDDKKTAIKLLNKYADEYKTLEEEIKTIKSENKDLKINLKIHKDIIQGLFLRNPLDEKFSMIFNKLNEENLIISTQLEKITKEREEIKSKYSADQQIARATITQNQEDIEKLKTKIFLLENILTKKENTIMALQNKKRNKLYDDSTTHEVFISDPTVILNKINDELLVYKEDHKKLMASCKDLRSSLSRYEKLAHELEINYARCQQELKFQTMRATTLNNKLMLQNKKEDNISQNEQEMSQSYLRMKYMASKGAMELLSPMDARTNKSANLLKEKHRNLGLLGSAQNMSWNIIGKNEKTKRTIQQYEDFEENNRTRKEKTDMTEEWCETLKHCNMSQDEFLKYCKNKLMQKLCDAIEYLYKLLVEKNAQITLLSNVNENLNNDNLKLNKENIQLTEEIQELVVQLRLQETERKNITAVENPKDAGESVSVKIITTNGLKTKGDTGMIDSSGVIESMNINLNPSGVVSSTVNESSHTGIIKSITSTNTIRCFNDAEILTHRDSILANDHIAVKLKGLKKLVNVQVQTQESVTSSEFREGIAFDELDLASDMSRKKNNNIAAPSIDGIKSK